MPPELEISAADDDPKLRMNRLHELLRNLAKRGTSQRQAALQARVPVQYLSDVKNGHRTLTELFARRLQEEFGVNYLWLLGKSSDMQIAAGAAGQASGGQRLWLPLFPHPIEGDPYAHALWDGIAVEIAGAAAAKAVTARHPYILRFGAADRRGRLRRHDQSLISQEVRECAEIHVVKRGRKAFLARKNAEGEWEPLADQTSSGTSATVIGHVVGIIWGHLS